MVARLRGSARIWHLYGALILLCWVCARPPQSVDGRTPAASDDVDTAVSPSAPRPALHAREGGISAAASPMPRQPDDDDPAATPGAGDPASNLPSFRAGPYVWRQRTAVAAALAFLRVNGSADAHGARA